MNWLLVILFLNVPVSGWEMFGHDFFSREDCEQFAREINERQNFVNEEANRDGRLVLEQVYAWCEKK